MVSLPSEMGHLYMPHFPCNFSPLFAHGAMKSLPTLSPSAREVSYQALELVGRDPVAARAQWQEAATLWVAEGQARQAAFALHQRAGLALVTKESPVADLAAAAQLLYNHPEARAVVLLDLGHALHRDGDKRRARLVVKESSQLALRVGDTALAQEAQALLREIDAERMGLKDLGTTLRQHSPYLANQEFRDVIEIPPTSVQRTAEVHRREQAVAEELATLKQEMGL